MNLSFPNAGSLIRRTLTFHGKPRSFYLVLRSPVIGPEEKHLLDPANPEFRILRRRLLR